MKKIYLDNAATSFPKPNSVCNGMMDFMTNIGSNPGRGANSASLSANRLIYESRETIMNFFNFNKLDNVIFTSNITASLNILLKTTIKDNWHIITSSMEHNSVLRPLETMKNYKNIEVDILKCNSNGLLDVDLFKNTIKTNTKLVILSHASNIIGSIQPLQIIGNICREKNIYFIIDSAQTAGVIPCNFATLNCNALAFTGHKGLLGPQGIGGFLIDDKLNSEATSYMEGGTGSLSELLTQPNFLPDKFESGTLNSPGIVGLLNGLKFINKEGISTIKAKEDALSKKFVDELLNMDFIELYGLKNQCLRTSTISINSKKLSNADLGFILDNEYGIITRTGLHCAPLAHKTIGTFPNGTIRFSFGYFNTFEDISYTIDSIYKIHKGK